MSSELLIGALSLAAASFFFGMAFHDRRLVDAGFVRLKVPCAACGEQVETRCHGEHIMNIVCSSKCAEDMFTALRQRETNLISLIERYKAELNNALAREQVLLSLAREQQTLATGQQALVQRQNALIAKLGGDS